MASVLRAGALDATKILGMRYCLKYKRGLENGQPKRGKHVFTTFPKDYTCEENRISMIMEVEIGYLMVNL